MISADDRLEAFLAAGGDVPVDGVLAFFDDLPPVGVDEMVGDWDGEVIATGHRGEQQLGGLRWAGKAFRSTEDVDPIVVHDDSGARVASEVMGAARLRSVEYRGAVTASMIYDRHPVIDHFRRVSDDVVLGAMDAKGDDAPLVFVLRRRAA